jgi:dTDP-4-amino-4,6-dideoxygalactose transaminase
VAWRIPFNRPAPVGREGEYFAEALASDHYSGDGPWTERCQELLRKELGAAKVLLTTSCTHALEMTALLLDLEPGDEVIVPSFSFVTSVNAFVLHGARPVFVDVRPDTLNLDETLLEAAVTPRTRAIVVVHYGGVACEMDPILDLARRHGLAVIEDNAHGLFGRYRGRPLGTLGSLATLSFHETKNFTCGEGGALVINEPSLTERSEILREKGTDRSRFFRGEVDKYTWVDVGSSYLPSDLLAAVLFAQLEERERIRTRREEIWRTYRDRLAGWAAGRGASLPTVPEHCDQTHHLFYLLLPSLAERTELIDHLKGRGILSVFHYLPLHLSAMGRRYGGRPGDCPVTEDVSDRLLRLPFYNSMTEAEQAEVVEAILDFGRAGG